MINDKVALYLAFRKTSPVSTKPLDFKSQDAFVSDPSQFIAAQCTRRAGKTNALALRFKRTMDLYPGSLSRYIALTRDSARDIMMPVLNELNEKYNWGATFTEQPLAMSLPNGSVLRLMGADMKNFIRRLKGAKSPAVAIDEAQEFGAHLENLVDDVLVPTIADYPQSWLALTGTPGPIPRGLFYDVTSQGKGGYSVHKWEVYDNPYMPDARKFVETLKERKQWSDRHPTYLREWKNEWVLDLESLLIKYNDNCHYDKLPNTHWNYILGIDIGLRDSDALAVIGWSESLPDIYLVEEVVSRDNDITQLVANIKKVREKYDISKMVIDTGGLGAKIAEEIIRRHHIPVTAADKTRKMENTAFLNDWLRLGRFKAKKDSRFAQDSYQVQIDYEKTTPDKLIVKKGFHSDIIDAVLYAFKESPAFTYQKPKEPPAYGTPQWAQAERDKMEEAAIEHFEGLEKAEKGFGEWG